MSYRRGGGGALALPPLREAALHLRGMREPSLSGMRGHPCRKWLRKHCALLLPGVVYHLIGSPFRTVCVALSDRIPASCWSC